MEIVTLEEVCDFLDNLRKPITAKDRVDGPYPYYGANGVLGYVNDYLFDEELVLLAEDGGFFDAPERGVAYRVSGKCWVNNHAHVLRPKNNIDVDYLGYVLKQYDVRPYVTGATVKKITQKAARQLKIPLPSLEEQKRIVHELDAADALRQKRKQTITLLDDYLKAVFLEMFGDPVQNPKQWEVKLLGDLSKKVTDGTHKTPQYQTEGVKFISAKNIKNEKITWEDIKYISNEEHADIFRRCNPQRDDLLLTKSGSLGMCAIVDVDFEFSLFESLALIKTKENFVDPVYLREYLNLKQTKTFYKQITKGVGVKHLHLIDIKSIPVLLPPKELQVKFVRVVQKIENLQQNMFVQGEAMETSFKALVQTSFQK